MGSSCSAACSRRAADEVDVIQITVTDGPMNDEALQDLKRKELPFDTPSGFKLFREVAFETAALTFPFCVLINLVAFALSAADLALGEQAASTLWQTIRLVLLFMPFFMQMYLAYVLAEKAARTLLFYEALRHGIWIDFKNKADDVKSFVTNFGTVQLAMFHFSCILVSLFAYSSIYEHAEVAVIAIPVVIIYYQITQTLWNLVHFESTLIDISTIIDRVGQKQAGVFFSGLKPVKEDIVKYKLLWCFEQRALLVKELKKSKPGLTSHDFALLYKEKGFFIRYADLDRQTEAEAAFASAAAGKTKRFTAALYASDEFWAMTLTNGSKLVSRATILGLLIGLGLQVTGVAQIG